MLTEMTWQAPSERIPSTRTTTEPALVRWVLIGAALILLALFLFVPLVVVFVQAFGKGVAV
jgi:sulfate/thiosulfate transport system permease protein